MFSIVALVAVVVAVIIVIYLLSSKEDKVIQRNGVNQDVQDKPTKRTYNAYDFFEDLMFYGVPGITVFLLIIPFSVEGIAWINGYSAPLLVLLLVWWLLGFFTVQTKERVVKKLLQKPYATHESGLAWIPYLLGSVDRRSTEIQSLDFPHVAGILTKHGVATDSEGRPVDNGRVYGSITLAATISMQFQYPSDDRLIDVVVKLPEGQDSLIDLFEEPVLDQVRTVGGDKVYKDLVQRRSHFARQVMDSLRNDPDGVVGRLLRETGLDQVQISVKHLEYPPDVRNALNAHELAELTAAGVRTTADATKYKDITEGEGLAKKKSALLDVIKQDPGSMHAQALLTLIDMAQGQATTIFPLSTDLTNVLGNVLGGRQKTSDVEVDDVMRLLTPQQRETLLMKLKETMAPKGGN
jgi:regulator of protease activity HflC (stomatin/prohibitin superfamily)